MSKLNFKKPSIYRLGVSLVGILYVWSLPLLANIGFSQPNSQSISEFIANPPATGAMAAISFIPLTLMWEYQDYTISKLNYVNIEQIWMWSLVCFQGFYGLFLVCTDGIVPDWLHLTTVVMFGLSFIGHSVILLIYIESNLLTKLTLGIGIVSFIGLVFAKGLWFWALECVGFSSMLLFTPIEWLLIDSSTKSYQMTSTNLS